MLRDTRPRSELAGIGLPWLRLERVMGIEYIAWQSFDLSNQEVACAAGSACDFCVKNAAIPANASERRHLNPSE
jgi:hypothetical protein